MLYLVRHGEAHSEGPDYDRVLTDHGIADVERVAAWAARVGVSVDAIHHSGRRRALQTASIFAAHLNPPNGISAIEGIHPNDDPAAFDVPSSPVMIVSHLPFVAHLAATLSGASVVFRPCTLVALVPAEGRWAVECVVHPGVV